MKMTFNIDEVISLAVLSSVVFSVITGIVVYCVQKAVHRCKHQFELIQDDRVEGLSNVQHTTVYMCKDCGKTKVVKTVIRL
jgi:DNA-directed RNA polymerase subunit RPC12/RpoP